MAKQLDITSVERGERRDVNSQGAPRRSGSGGAVDWKWDFQTAVASLSS
jgi:hypothetical protein